MARTSATYCRKRPPVRKSPAKFDAEPLWSASRLRCSEAQPPEDLDSSRGARATLRAVPPTDSLRSSLPALSFRAACPADVDAVVTLVESAYRGEASRAGWTTEADLLDGQRTDREEVASLVALPSARIVLCFEPERLVGTVLVRAVADATSHIGMFAVSPALQARGIGSALLAEAERVAREHQAARRTEMTVIAQREDIIRWYTRRGYRLTGETEPFPYGNRRFGLPRRDDLVFLLLAKDLTDSARRST